MNTKIQSLHREDVIKAIEKRNPPRIPLVRAKWWGEGLREQYGDRLKTFDRFPEDVVWFLINNPVEPALMDLSWEWKASAAHDASCIIDDWSKLDEFIEKLPKAQHDTRFEELVEKAQEAHSEDRYILFGFWTLFFERPWMLRGMENLMCDYHAEPDNVNKLHKALSDTYCDYIRAAHSILKPDGFWTSDDLGHQTGPMMSPGTFTELILPYYNHVGATLKNCNMHFWLHSCGDNTLLLPGLIKAGVTVFHPVQKHTMDEASVAAEFGDDITFLAGIDVQHTLQEKDPEGIRAEVRFLIDTFDRSDGGMCIAAGNGIVTGTPLENIEAFLDEAVKYGTAHRNE